MITVFFIGGPPFLSKRCQPQHTQSLPSGQGAVYSSLAFRPWLLYNLTYRVAWESGMDLGRSRLNSIKRLRSKTRTLVGFSVVLFLILVHLGSVPEASSQTSRPLLKNGDPLPRISFHNSLTPSEARYLGIGPRKNFSLEDINARMILVDFINSNCHYCMESVPLLNEIYRSIEKDPALRSHVKLVAVGAGDTSTEVEHFKRTHGVLFPILPDTEYQAHDAIGGPRVPFLIIAIREGRGKWVVVDTKVGLIGTMESKTITYLEEDPLVETVEGEIASVEKFVTELKALLAARPETSKTNKSPK